MVNVCQLRFIPAGAGNTPSASSPALDISVYPRWRGEHASGVAYKERLNGLSPLARGTPSRWQTVGKKRRFIPAGAGNTPSQPPASCLISVYPRWRGEDCIGVENIKFNAGLSPLARGTPCVCCRKCSSRRFIPAGAGNTPTHSFTVNQISVYPRWRGEHC
ncbi:Domain of uncharacterised function (DUF2825) [Salmonella enterica subsp. enterica serovar Derby]|nr:Domain of uncharacterised function (DUF2825) [Salmonella enterica subsp. enterica serovar Derby]